MSEAGKYVSDIGVTGVAKFLIGFQALLLLPILTKFLGPEAFGVWSQIKVTLALILPIVSLGLPEAISRYLTGMTDKKEVSRIWISAVFLTVLLLLAATVAYIVLAEPLSYWLTKTTTAYKFFLMASALILLRGTSSMVTRLYKINKEFKRFSAWQIMNAILEVLLVLLFLSIGFSVDGVIYAYITAIVVATSFAWFQNKKYIQYQTPDIKSIKPQISYGMNYWLVPLFAWIFQVGDQYILGLFYGAGIVGIYALAYSLGYSIRIISQSITSVLYFQLIDLWNKGKKKQFAEYFRYSYKYLFLIIIPASFGVVALSREIIILVATKEFLAARYVLPFIVFGMLLFMLWTFCTIILEVHLQPNEIRNAFFMFTIMNISLNLILVPRYQLYGAAVATLITFIFSAAYSVFIFRRYQQDLMLGTLVRMVLAAIIMYAAIIQAKHIFNLPLLLQTCALVLLGAMIYFVCVFIFRVITLQEIRRFYLSIKDSSGTH